jgi:endo-1,4-beta-mannosidase
MPADGGLNRGERFRVGVNYWPARTAMGWWAEFDHTEVASDFARIAASGLDSVRLFLTWEDFQPACATGMRTRLSPEAAAAYTERALVALRRAGCAGAMLWCYADYDPAIWEQPPLDVAVHERSFGLWRADGSPKPSVAAVEAFTGAVRVDGPDDYKWIDIEPDEFFRDPRVHLHRLYHRYRKSGGSPAP